VITWQPAMSTNPKTSHRPNITTFPRYH
jgi:hypothetical protein